MASKQNIVLIASFIMIAISSGDAVMSNDNNVGQSLKHQKILPRSLENVLVDSIFVAPPLRQVGVSVDGCHITVRKIFDRSCLSDGAVSEETINIHLSEIAALATHIVNKESSYILITFDLNSEVISKLEELEQRDVDSADKSNILEIAGISSYQEIKYCYGNTGSFRIDSGAGFLVKSKNSDELINEVTKSQIGC